MAPGQRDVWPSPAQELLLRATLIPDERALAAWRQVRSQIEVAKLDHATQSLLPVLRKNLLALGEDDELLSLFKGVHRYSWARNQMLLAPMMPVVQALERAEIRTLLLKGAAFVADRRLDAGMRAMNDVDVLVPCEQRAAAIEVLLSGGLVPVGGVPPWYVADYAPRFVPSHGFRDGKDRQLDLHWHVLHASCQRDADDDFWAAATPIELLGVKTLSLCPADELLLVILHGMRWNAVPTYRWVLDAAQLCGGQIGEIDYDRLVAQARRRRVAIAVRAGLEYLKRVVGAQVPAQSIRALASLRPRVLERMELRAQMTQPRARSAQQWGLLYHQQYMRRELPLSARPTLIGHVRLGCRRLGIASAGELRDALAGGVPGPGRPPSEMSAAVGTGERASTADPVRFGQPIELGQPDVARDHTAYGTWRAEGEGCWIAGREAKLVLPLAGRPSTSLLLEISADGYLPSPIERQRLGVAVNGMAVAELSVAVGASLTNERVVLPYEALQGRDSIELLLQTPDCATPARLGVADDDRSMSVYLRRMTLRPARACRLGEELHLGGGIEDEGMLLRGWGHAEEQGRWTVGSLAEVLLWVDGPGWPGELQIDAVPFLGLDGRALQVDVAVNGSLAGTVNYERESASPLSERVAIKQLRPAGGGQLLIGLRIRDPRSPRSLGISEDERALGLFVTRIVLLP